MDWSIVAWKNIYFAEPDKLLLLYPAAALFLFGLTIWVINLAIRPKRTFGSKYPLLGTIKFWISSLALLVCCIVAYAMPFISKGAVNIVRGSAEVVFIVDYSGSMLLKDTGWARLDIAGREITRTVLTQTLRKGDRAGLFIFGKTVSPMIYLTSDLDSFGREADKVGRPETLLFNDIYWGTAAGSGSKRVYESLDRQDMFAELHKESENWRPRPKKNRLIFFISDGDFYNYGKEPYPEVAKAEAEALKNALAELRKRGVPVYTIGIGTRSGGRLIDILQDYTKDEYESGLADELSDQYSSLNPGMINSIAEATGGRSFFIENSKMDAANFIKAAIDRYRSIRVQAVPENSKFELWPYCLLAGLLLFIVGLLITKF